MVDFFLGGEGGFHDLCLSNKRKNSRLFDFDKNLKVVSNPFSTVTKVTNVQMA